MNMIDVSDELQELSKQMVQTIENEDKEFMFKQNKGYVERNVPALKFKKNIVGLTVSEIGKIILNKDGE